MNCVVWFFGRGASIACNFEWGVPAEWEYRDRLIQVEKIKAAVQKGMDQPGINTAPYTSLLSKLSQRTVPEWRHRFVTTNWDYLLQREISRQPWKMRPPWLEDSHVYHLNGTVECSPGSNIPNLRSPFLLETDQTHERTSSKEFDDALRFIGWRKHFVVIGMSFSCPTDRAFLVLLHRIRDVRPIGTSYWHVVDLSEEAGEKVRCRIKEVLPGADVTVSRKEFKEWIVDGMPELERFGILTGGI